MTITYHLNFSDYRKLDAVNWSSLKHLRESPLKYKYELSAPSRDTVPLQLGRAAHALVFEPHTFERDFAIYEGGDRRGKVWEAFKAEHAGQTILKINEIESVTAMAAAVRTHPLVVPYLDDGEYEKSITWTDPGTELPCKARLDFINAPRKALIDLKTTGSIDAFRFGRIAARFGYHCQLGGHYRNGVTHALGWEPEETFIIAVETDAPYDVAVFYLDDEDCFAGAEEVAELMARLKAHREADLWPGRYPERQRLLLPQYVFGDDDTDPSGIGINFNSPGE